MKLMVRRCAAGSWVSAFTSCTLAFVLVPLFQQTGHAGQARPAVPAVYSAAQAQRGQAIYQAQCVTCHGKTLEGDIGPMLTGEAFLSRWAGRSVADLVDKIHHTMPQRAPGTLMRQQAIDVAAFLLQAGNFPAGQIELSDAALSLVTFPGTPSPAMVTAAGLPLRHTASLAQVMRGITFPNANILFNTQNHNPAELFVKKEPTPPATQDFLEWGYGVYPGWQAVDQAALAIIDSSSLFLVPGRRCENGRAVPVDRPDFRKFTEELITVGDELYRASQTRNQDTISEATDKLQLACQNCHRVYRNNGNRCAAGAAPAAR
jgi:mono/diheme cytochrome c family protein